MVLILISVFFFISFYNEKHYIKKNLLSNIESEFYQLESKSKYLEELKRNLNILDKEYTWEEKLNYNLTVKKIVIHHSSTNDASCESIHAGHIRKGWNGIGYHFFISKEGIIYRGRPEEAIGAHAKGINDSSLGICLEGNFQEEDLKKEQEEPLLKLLRYLLEKYDINDIIGHRDAYYTACPGKNIDLNNIKNKM